MTLSFEPEALRALAELLNSTGLSEIELEEGGRKLRLARTIASVGVALPAAPIPVLPQAVVAEAGGNSADLARHPGAVKSPMVGVAYLSAEPDAPPYVTVGQAVEAGQTLLLIEAMKTFNQIKAPRAGVVKRILVASGTPVEYDEALLIIE
jgi:acetyl-CoA carboxylase biotin carboxyl carrier protein